MNASPPPDAVILTVQGVRGSLDRMRVEQALKRGDPGAQVWTDWPGGRVAVKSSVPAERIRRAVQDAGFIAAHANASAPVEPREVGRTILRVVGYSFAGFVLGTLVGAAIAIGVVMVDPACNLPGDSGGCAMGIPAIAIGAGMLGAPIGFVLALIRRGRRRGDGPA